MSGGATPELPAALVELAELSAPANGSGDTPEATADTEGRQRWLHEHAELRTAQSVAALCKEAGRLLWIEVERARAYAEAARWLAHEVGDEPWQGKATRMAANALHCAGESADAQQLYEEALVHFQELGETLEVAITRSSSLLNLAYLGRYDQVLAWHMAARESFEELGDRLRLAILDHNFANILYRQDRWQEAMERYRIAHGEFVLLGRHQDAAICLRNIAVCHISLHQFEEALATYESSRAYCEQQGLHRLVLEVDYNIAYLYYLRGEYTRAIRLFRAARRRCDAEGDEYHRALCDLDQAEIYLELNMVDEAAALSDSASRGFADLERPYESAKALTNRALAASRRSEAPLALELLSQARKIFEQEKNLLWPALIDFYRAVVLHREQQPQQAIRIARRARRTFTESSLAPRAAMCELLLAELLLDTGQLDQARQACRRALVELAELEMPALEHRAHHLRGRIEEVTGRPEAAYDAYLVSQRWLEKLRCQLQGEDLKIAFLEDKHTVYESLVRLTMDRPADTERDRTAFSFIEKAKSRSLADLLSFRAHELAPREPAEGALAARVRALRKSLNWYYRQIDLLQMRADESQRAEAQRLRRSTRGKEDELLRALHELQTADRELSSLQAEVEIEVDRFQASLPEDGQLVEYYVAGQRVYSCLVDRRGLEMVPLGSVPRIRELHRLLQFQLSRRRLATSSDDRGADDRGSDLIEEATRGHLQELYAALIAPLADRLTGRHLIFAPHSFLHYVPFHALMNGNGFLVDHFSVSYAPSASVFHLCTQKRSTYQERSLVLGVSDERAPYILEEARAVAEVLPDATLLTGEEAREESLLQHAPGCRYLHLATHGLFRSDNPMFSAIQLGGSRLSLFDLYNLRLDAELVVLSGCGTGLHAVRGADELVGLARGLLYAGARAVLVTLWDVNDASTAEFMRLFYRHLSTGRAPARALQRAMQELRRTLDSPFFWAPFVLIGDVEGSVAE